MTKEHMIYYVTIKGYPTPIAIWAKDHDDYESQLRQFLDDEDLHFPDKAITYVKMTREEYKRSRP